MVYGIDLLVCDKVVNFRMTVDTEASQELMDENYSEYDVFSIEKNYTTQGFNHML